ncbi:MAG: alpha-mannosidase [Opitutaceae bacterium]|nr:alpha-mannosidase [Opitutaceae bacterium]
MFSANPFLQLVPNRAAAALSRLREATWAREETLVVEATPPQPKHLGLAAASKLSRRVVRAETTWGRLFDQRWCRVTFSTLSRHGGRPRYLEWQDQGEATLYVDGVPYYGFDVAHRHVKLPAGLREAWIECHCLQSAIWHPDATGVSRAGSVFTGAFLCRRDDDAWHAYHDLKCLFDLMLSEKPGGPKLNAFGQQLPVSQCSPFQRQLLRALDDLCDALDTGGPAALRRRAANAYSEFRQAKPFLHGVLSGHAHLDLVWLWPERIGEAKAVHLFATANHLMSLYPEYRFAYSQPASYAAVGRHAPALLEEVKRRMRAGRWQATGALYVESDTLIACGEALARSFACGQVDFTRLRGEPARLLWLPDVFGYAGCLPQLMRLAGVEYFFTTKLTWSAIHRFPHSSFVWRGTDGSEVVAHVTQDTGYNNWLTVEQLVANARGHAQGDIHREFLHPTGYGDGGGGPSEEICERARRLDALPGLPGLKWDHPESFFDRLAQVRDRLPVHQGECYLEYHRGTYTTHSHLKAAFRALECALQAREAAAVALGQLPDLGAVWRRLIFAQFHDYIPGSSVPEVYEEGVPELHRHAAEQLDAARRSLDTAGGELCVFNPIPVARRVVHAGRLLDLPALAGATIEAATVSDFEPVVAHGRTLSNGRVAVRIGAQGELASLTIEGQAVALRPDAGRLVLYPDRAANFEAWDIDRQALALGKPVTTSATMRVEVERGGLRGATSVTRRVGRASRATVRYALEAGASVLRIDVELDWREPETLLKLHFATDYRGPFARCGAPFGSVLRPQQPLSTQAEAMWEVPASRWVAVTDEGGGAGLCVVTENKYGFSVSDGDVGVSLVRSPRITGFEDHRKVYPPGLSRLPVESIYSDQGVHRISLAVARYDASLPRVMQPAALVETLFGPLIDYRGSPVMSPGWCGLDGGETLVPCWAQPVGSGAWILRLHEVGGARGTAQVVLAPGWSAEKVDLRGQVIRGVSDSGSLTFRPHEIVGLRISPRKGAPKATGKMKSGTKGHAPARSR